MLSHRNIITFHEIYYTFKNHEKYLVLVMDFFPSSLQDILDRHSKLETTFPADHIRSYISQMLKGLHHMHKFGITHRDIKPDNILIDESTSKTVLADIGSAKRV